MLTIMSITGPTEVRELGATVREVRKARSLTQQELAMAAGVGRGVLQKLEEGRGTVNVDSLIRIARALSCDVRLIARQSGRPPSALRGGPGIPSTEAPGG